MPFEVQNGVCCNKNLYFDAHFYGVTSILSGGSFQLRCNSFHCSIIQSNNANALGWIAVDAILMCIKVLYVKKKLDVYVEHLCRAIYSIIRCLYDQSEGHIVNKYIILVVIT